MDGPLNLPPGPSGFLAALQLADSFFPTGMYAHSHGLEGLIARGQVGTADDVAEFLENQLAWSVLPSDGVTLLNAHCAAAAGELESLRDMDRLLYALKLPQELRDASTQVGQRLLAETAHLLSEGRREMASPSPLARGELEGGQRCATIHAGYQDKVAHKESPGNGAVALGVAACALDIPAAQALLLFCHSHAVSVLGAALRLLSLTHTDAQAILRRLQPVISAGAAGVAAIPWQDMTSFTPELDIAAMNHEAADLRMFAS